jgi:hypothetical protein
VYGFEDPIQGISNVRATGTDIDWTEDCKSAPDGCQAAICISGTSVWPGAHRLKLGGTLRRSAGRKSPNNPRARMQKQILSRLLIDLAWNISRLEGSKVGLLKDVFIWACERSAARYTTVRHNCARYRAVGSALISALRTLLRVMERWDK